MTIRTCMAPLVACALSVAGCGSSTAPGDRVLKAQTALPPGNSGLVTADGQAAGSASGTPSDFGPNLDDQRTMYWSYQYKPGSFDRKGTLLAPAAKDGVEIYLDPYGVPSVYADNVHDLWFGVGYVAAMQRLFIMDAVRRYGRGTAAALLGCTYVPQDIQTRTLTYTDAEYQAFFDRLQPDSKASFQGYVDGANAWLAQLSGAQSSQMPAEYGLLSTTPEPFTVTDLLAAGVLITRRVASEGGDEFFNVRELRALENAYGKAEGRKMFLDLVWDEDRKAVTTVPGRTEFRSQDVPFEGREAAFDARADWAVNLPDTVWLGLGTGGAAEPAPCTGTSEDGTTAQASAKPQGKKARAFKAIRTEVANALKGLYGLHAGSWAAAIGRTRTRDGGAMVISSPQLGYSYPSYLWEAEIHGAGYEARGVSVPGLPVIGIGYSPYLGWALTTGNTKTIDSFIETICSTSQVQAGACKADQYFHDGQWKDMECHSETIPYRSSDSKTGLPSGAATFSTTAPVCRTVHGPVVARDDALGMARAVYYAMRGHEIDNVEGVREWNRAKNLGEFMAATAKLSWNENVTFATRDGDIGYVHPGRHPDRAPSADQRFPVPGTGEFDFKGWLPFERVPKSINPAQGYLANWNTKPALGWLDGEGMGYTSRPAGPGQRVTTILDTLASRSDWTFDALPLIDHAAGARDPRAREYLPVLGRMRAPLTAGEQHALELVLGWDRNYYGPDVTLDDANSTDTAAATIFDAWIKALQADLFGELEPYVLYSGTRDLDLDGDYEQTPMDPDVKPPNENIYNREKSVGNHRYDVSAMDNLILRIFDPSTSSLAVRHDWLRGRDPNAVLHATLTSALASLATQYGTANPPAPADVDTFKRVHPKRKICALSKVIGPGPSSPQDNCVRMPFQDRGSWVHLVGFEKP